jgi:hypothetical protein
LAEGAADVQVRHPEFGILGALEIIRRNAHEVHHHLADIERARCAAVALRSNGQRCDWVATHR